MPRVFNFKKQSAGAIANFHIRLAQRILSPAAIGNIRPHGQDFYEATLFVKNRLV